MDTPAYLNATYHKLLEDDVRDMILKGELKKDDVGNDDVYNLLKLLQNNNFSERSTYTDVTLKEWMQVVKHSNANSTSSVYSRRTYAVYKISLDSDIITDSLLRYYNVIMKKRYYVKR